MGPRITKTGLRVDLAKVTTINDLQPPTNIGELRRFVAMANYMARFLPHATTTQLTKVPYVWSQTQQTQFDAVKLMDWPSFISTRMDKTSMCILTTNLCEGSLVSAAHPISFALMVHVLCQSDVSLWHTLISHAPIQFFPGTLYIMLFPDQWTHSISRAAVLVRNFIS